MAVNVDFDYFSRHSDAGCVLHDYGDSRSRSHLLSQTGHGHLELQLGLIRLERTSCDAHAMDRRALVCVIANS